MVQEGGRSRGNARAWELSPRRFLSGSQVTALRACARGRAESRRWGKRSAVVEWSVLEIAFETGLRVSEIAALQCGDLELNADGGNLLVRRGKGGKSRTVMFGKTHAKSLAQYLDWKLRRGELVEDRAPLLPSGRTGRPLTSRALQKMFARVAKAAGVEGHSIHHLRHTYATFLLRASGGNLRLVQKQLGHSAVTVTQVYADVMQDETMKAVSRLYEGGE